jgi:hypothetical protein
VSPLFAAAAGDLTDGLWRLREGCVILRLRNCRAVGGDGSLGGSVVLPISTAERTAMARARPGLAKAVTDILEARGADGKRLSFRQAERLTGLAPATISELAKGNARTPETVRRFAAGTGEDVSRLLLLAGFVPDDQAGAVDAANQSPRRSATAGEPGSVGVDPEEKEWLGRMGRALAMLPPGRERDLWKENLRRNTELIESFLERAVSDRRSDG